jgi:bacteriocin-like protein
MDKKKKNLLPQTTRPSKRISIQDLPTQLIELSEKELHQIVGGFAFGGSGTWTDR